MSSRHFLFVIAAHWLPSKNAVGGEFAGRSDDLATLRAAIEGQYGRLIEITPDQWRFLRGVYAMNVEAPPGLPCGDDVVLAQGGDSDGLLFFVDGNKLGAPMHGTTHNPLSVPSAGRGSLFRIPPRVSAT